MSPAKLVWRTPVGCVVGCDDTLHGHQRPANVSSSFYTESPPGDDRVPSSLMSTPEPYVTPAHLYLSPTPWVSPKPADWVTPKPAAPVPAVAPVPAAVPVPAAAPVTAPAPVPAAQPPSRQSLLLLPTWLSLPEEVLDLTIKPRERSVARDGVPATAVHMASSDELVCVSIYALPLQKGITCDVFLKRLIMYKNIYITSVEIL